MKFKEMPLERSPKALEDLNSGYIIAEILSLV
jgi:hypothetical protein